MFHRAYFKGFARDVPYAVALVGSTKACAMFSNLVGVPREQIRIGMRVARGIRQGHATT